MTRVVRVVWLTALWVVLWSDLTVANVVGGLLVAGLVVGLFDSWRDRPVVVRPLAAIRFHAVFAVMLVRSTLSVARTVVWPRGRITTGIVAVPLRGCSDAVVTVVANAISLTPGTLTLEARRDPLVLYVHVLDARDLDAVRADVRRLEVLAVRAFGDADALAGLEVDDIEAWRAS